MHTKIITLAAAFVAGVAFAGNVYYVDPSGNDGADGESAATARKSLVEVMKLVTPNNGDVVYAAEGTYNIKSDGGYRVNVPAGTKLVASGRRSETIIEGAAATGVATDASPWGCGSDAVSCVYLNSNAELHGFTVRGGYGQQFANNSYGGGVVGAGKSTCIAYDCTIVDNVAGDCAGVNGVTAIRCDIGRNTAKRWANMHNADAYSCYLHEENTPVDTYCYGYSNSCTLNGCTIMPRKSGSNNAGVNGSTCINCYTRNERNTSKLWYTAYTGKGGSTVVNDGCMLVTTDTMVMGADYRPVFGSNKGVDKGSWHSYTNGASAKVLAYLDKDYAGGPRVSGLEMDMGCGECQMEGPEFSSILHKAQQFSVVSVSQTGVAPTGGVALVIRGGSEATWRWTVPESTKVAVGYSLKVAVDGEATFAAYVGGAATPACTVTAADGVVPFGYLYTGTHDVRLVVSGAGSASVSTLRCSDFGVNNWYVNPAGDDLADGKTPSTARRTLVEVMKLASSGDVVHAARGTYAEGFSQTMASNDHTTNRVIVAQGVGLVADEGPEVTFIQGAKPSAGGNTGPDAIRCVTLQFEAWLKGFTLKDGATVSHADYQDYGGGVYYSNAQSSTACTFGCVFDNCSARRGGGGYGGVFAGCRFESTCSAGTEARALYSCSLAVNCVFKAMTYGIYRIVNCSAIGCEIRGNGVQHAYNTYFGVVGNSNITKHDSRVGNAEMTAEALDETFGPRLGSVLVNAGDANHYRTNFPPAWAMFSGTAINGSKRVLGASIDIGAGEFAFNPSAIPESAGVTVTVDGGAMTVTRNYKSAKLVTGFTLNGTVHSFPIDGSADSVTVPCVIPLEENDFDISYADTVDYYVDKAGGSDDNHGYAPGDAFKTLKKALETVGSGGTVYVAPGVYGEGTMTQGEKSYVAVVPSGVKLVATGTKEECIIEGAADMDVSQDSNPYGCGDKAVRCVYLNSNAEIHGFTIRNGHGHIWRSTGSADDPYSCGGVVGRGSTTLVYDCTVTNNYGSSGPGINNAVAVRCEIGWNWSGSEGGGANMRNGWAYNCFIHDERAPDSAYVYGCNAVKIVACTVFDQASGSRDAGVVSCDVYDSYLRHERNLSRMYRTYYEAKGGGATTDDASRLVTRSQMRLDGDLVPVYGENVGIDNGSWLIYTNGAPAIALKYLDKDFNGNPRVSNGAMDIGCCEFDYCGVYSQKLRAGRRVYTVTSASPAVTLADGGVNLSDGDTLAGTFATGRPGDCFIIAEVTGGGTLTVTLDGNPLAAENGRYVFTCEPGTEHELSFSFAGDGSATVKQVHGPVVGMILTVR